jgi:hypothetical protein
MVEARINTHAAFIWSVADLLRGDYKQSEYGKVVLPLTVLRRLDCVLEPAKPAVLARSAKLRGQVDNVGPVLCAVAGQRFYNISPLDGLRPRAAGRLGFRGTKPTSCSGQFTGSPRS